MTLSGLPNASIPVGNVYGDLENDQTDPGGEAQLDVEYIMVRNLPFPPIFVPLLLNVSCVFFY